MDSGVLAKAQIHHVALRVADAQASKSWLKTMFNFRVDGEFRFADTDFVWMRPAEGNGPIIEIIGGAEQTSPPTNQNISTAEDAMAALKQPGFNHICLQIADLEQALADLRRHHVKILLDVMAGPPGSGVARCAFIRDPWGNIFELLEASQNPETR